MTRAQLRYLASKVSFAYPVRPWRLTKIDADFLGPAYFQIFGRHHRGIDINGIGGGDTDLGLPVQSMFPGRVQEAENYRGWGQTVLVRSEPWVAELAELMLETPVPVLEVQYTHLHQVTVGEGDLVNAGDHLGSIGKGDRNQYPAHLHLEVRRASFAANAAQESTEAFAAWVRDHCLDPREVMKVLPMSDYGGTLPPRRMAAVTERLVHNDRAIAGDRVVVQNRFPEPDVLYIYDQREGVPEIHSFYDALRYAVRLWRNR
jgi:murein DD-endopeptidase MepM/ murein hydrolase activator NlpD